jgi:next-to-BRCA1 protein 1
LKITTPVEAPGLIICAIGQDNDLSLESHLDLQSQPELAKEFADFLHFRKTKNVPAPVVVVAAPQAPIGIVEAPIVAVAPVSPLAPVPAVLAPPPTVSARVVAERPKCKHMLKTFVALHSGFHCDQCHMRVPPKTTLHGCRMCNFDLCDACFASSGSSTPIAPVIAKPPAQPQAKFVCDVTLADGSMVRPGEHLDKTWRIRNCGEEPWPAGTKLMSVGGDIMGGPVFGQEVPSNVRPGEAVNVRIDLVMPTLPGRYTSYWRLTTPHPQNARFGHRFWVTVNVVPNAFSSGIPSFVRPPPPPAPVTVAPAVVHTATAPPPGFELDDEFSMSVAQIVDFGFTDMDKIVAVLREENGDTGRTIDRLLAENNQ